MTTRPIFADACHAAIEADKLRAALSELSERLKNTLPLPWAVREDRSGYCKIKDANFRTIARNLNPADAEIIVELVNYHLKLNEPRA